MNRLLQITEDGSHTYYVCDLDEPYHSMHGALQESEHVFINQGLKQIDQIQIQILELGFGTGLNALLTLRESISTGTRIFYHTVEKYPLNSSEYASLNYESHLDGVPGGILQEMHQVPWDQVVCLTSNFTILKEKSDFRNMKPSGPFDLIYFDAFAPEKQPELWTEEVFSHIASLASQGAILVTYSSKGIVRRALKKCGFDVIKVPGPAGKREIIRAIKI